MTPNQRAIVELTQLKQRVAERLEQSLPAHVEARLLAEQRQLILAVLQIERETVQNDVRPDLVDELVRRRAERVSAAG